MIDRAIRAAIEVAPSGSVGILPGDVAYQLAQHQRRAPYDTIREMMSNSPLLRFDPLIGVFRINPMENPR